MNLNLKDLEWAAVAAAWAAGSWNSFVPDAYTLRREVCQGEPGEIRAKLADARSGYTTAILQSAAVGGAISLLIRSPWPLIAALGADAIAVVSYESHVPSPYRLFAGDTHRAD